MEKLLFLDPKEIFYEGEWLFWKEEPSYEFIESIKKIGLIFPVVVCKEQDKYVLICGYKRLKACILLKQKVKAILIPPQDLLTKGQIYFYSNIFHPISSGKLIRPLRFFKKHMNEREFHDFLDNLKNLLDPRTVYNLDICTKLPTNWDELFEQDVINVEMGELLIKFDLKELDLIKPLFDNLKWSFSNAKRLLRYLLEIKKITKESLKEILDEVQVFSIIEKDLNPKDKISRILDNLKKMRFPILSEVEKEFKELKRDLEKNTLWRVDVDKGFESDRINLTISINSIDQLKEASIQLNNIIEGPFFEKIKKWQDEKLNLKEKS